MKLHRVAASSLAELCPTGSMTESHLQLALLLPFLSPCLVQQWSLLCSRYLAFEEIKLNADERLSDRLIHIKNVLTIPSFRKAAGTALTHCSDDG